MKRFVTAAVISLMAGLASADPTIMSAEQALEARARALATIEREKDLDAVPGQIIVKFRGGDLQARSIARQMVSGKRVRELEAVAGLEHLEVGMDTQRAIAFLSALPFVEYAEPDYIVRPAAVPNDQFIGLQWGVNNTGQSIRGVIGVADADIDGFEAWDIRTSAPGIIVAVLDSGVQWSHPDLDGNIWSNTDEIAGNGIDDDNNGYIDDVRGWDFFDNDNNPDDPDGHGTHCAGTIGAEGNNGIGVAGVAWDVQIMPLRFIGPFGGSTSDAIAALNYAVANGAQISNNSWGGGGFSTAMRDAISNAAAAGHLFVAAAGNSNVNTDSTPFYPSSYTNDNIISVAAIDNRDQRASFSNFGANSVDLGAPGVDIASTYTGSTYVWSSGTSMAAPHVAGAAAILWAQNPTWTYAQVRDRLFATVRPTSAMSNTTATGGVLDLQAALGSGGGDPPANTPPSVTISSPSTGSTFTAGASVTFSGGATDAEDGNISGSVVWTSSINGQIGTGASFSTSTLSVGTHTITASATDSGNLSDAASVSITIQSNDPPATAPAAPSGLTVTGGSNRTAVLNWSDNSNNETGFQIRRQTRVGGSWSSSVTVGTVGEGVTQFVDNPGSGRFRYSVRAVNAVGNSTWTSWVQIRIR